MRQMISSGSVKAFYLDSERLLKKIKDISEEAPTALPDIKEIRLFGSLAKGDETGFSDVDIFVLIEDNKLNPIERMKPYFNFFSDRPGYPLM